VLDSRPPLSSDPTSSGMPQPRRSLFNRALKRVKSEGFTGSLRYARWYVLYNLHYLMGDRPHEKLEAVSTSRVIDQEDLDLDGELRQHSTQYLATPRWVLQLAIQSIPEPPERFTFVDIGSGLGRVLLVAGAYPFRSVLGFEASPSLHEGAMRNIDHFCANKPFRTEVRSVPGNALDAIWPQGRCIFFMFNPFDGELTKVFLDRIAERREDCICDYLLLLNFKYHALAEAHGFQRCQPSWRLSLYWMLLSPYSLTIYRTDRSQSAA
jgi:SAM-dependent methyltransferase